MLREQDVGGATWDLCKAPSEPVGRGKSCERRHQENSSSRYVACTPLYMFYDKYIQCITSCSLLRVLEVLYSSDNH